MLVHGLFYFIVLIFVTAWMLVCLNIRVRYNAVKLWWGMFIVALAFFVLQAEPSVTDDLNRHYYNINRIIDGTLTIKDTVRYTEFFYFWLVGKTGILGLLPFSAVLIYGITIWKIIEIRTPVLKTGACNQILLYLFAALAGCGIFYIVSGIRYSLTVVLWYYFYLRFYKDKKILYCFLCLILLLLHTGTVLLFLLALLHEHYFKTIRGMRIVKIAVVVFFAFLLMRFGVVEQFLSLFKFGYAKEILSKYMLYKDSAVRSIGDIRTYFLYIYYFLMFYAAFCWYRRERNSDNLAITNSFIALLTCGFVIAFERMSYVLGITSLPLIQYMYKGRVSVSEKRVFTMVSGLFFGVIAFHSFYAMLCHLQFNGVDFRNEIFNFFL